MSKNKKTIALFDGSNMIYRSFWAVKNLTTQDGIATNAVYGALKSFRSVVNSLHPDYVIVCWDSGKPSFRTEIDESYKAHRPGAPSDLKIQFPILQEAFRLLGVPQIVADDGNECDDIIGTLAFNAHRADMNAIIVSSDKDFYQLTAFDNVKLYSFSNNKKGNTTNLIDGSWVAEQSEVSPMQTIDVKALTGEKTDNIPGVNGIGPKTATALIKQYDNVENMLQELNLNKSAKYAEKILPFAEQILMAKRLATINIEANIEEIPVLPVHKIEADSENLKAFFEHYEFSSFLEEFNNWRYLFGYKTTFA